MAPVEAVWAMPELTALILSYANLTPTEFVEAGRVCKCWREACHQDEHLVLKAARSLAFLTKGTFVGLFALTAAEADALPHETRARRTGGHMFLYTTAAIEAAIPLVGGVGEWKRRLSARAVKQASIEQTFGPDWRDTYWPVVRITVACSPYRDQLIGRKRVQRSW